MAIPVRIGLFIPCYIDQFYPHVGLATVELLETCGCELEFPAAQTCCGQPMANTGCTGEARPLAERFLEIFAPYDAVVAPSGSCVAMVRHHYDEYLDGRPGFEELKHKTWELTEFLHDVLATFRSEAPHLLAALRRSLEAGDVDELRRAAHTLKSNGAALGAGAFATLCGELEEQVKRGRLDGANDLTGRIESGYVELDLALAALVTGEKA